MKGRVRVTGLPAAPEFEPGAPSEAMDAALAAAGAQSFVLVPTRKPGRRFTFRRDRPLPEMDGWYAAEMADREPHKPIPALLGFDVSRRAARALARELGVAEFLWGSSGVPVQTHATQWYDQDEWSEWSKVKEKAWTGVPDFVGSLRRLRERDENWSRDDRKLLDNPLTTTASVAVLAVALTVALVPAPSMQPFGAAFGLLYLATHPALIAAACLGILLRPELAPGRMRARDAAAAEGRDVWRRVSPRLAILWCVTAIAVVLLSWLRGESGFLAEPTTALLLGLWMVLPVATATDLEKGIETMFEAGLTAALSIFIIRMTLWVTDFLMSLVWKVLGAILPFDLPQALIDVVSGLANVAAELFFLMVMLGYAWFRLREYYVERSGET